MTTNYKYINKLPRAWNINLNFEMSLIHSVPFHSIAVRPQTRRHGISDAVEGLPKNYRKVRRSTSRQHTCVTSDGKLLKR